MKTRRGGMTLLEVVVALTVAGAALAAGASVLGFLTDQQERTGVQAVASAHAERATLREWVAAAQLSTFGDAQFGGASRSDQVAHDDEFTFVTSALTDVSSTGTQIHLRIDRTSADTLRGLVADLRPWRQDGAPRTVLLAAGATGLRVRYLPSVSGTRAWVTRWLSGPVLPAAVELFVEFDDARSTAATDRAANALLAIPMTIPLGASR